MTPPTPPAEDAEEAEQQEEPACEPEPSSSPSPMVIDTRRPEGSESAATVGAESSAGFDAGFDASAVAVPSRVDAGEGYLAGSRDAAAGWLLWPMLVAGLWFARGRLARALSRR